MEILSKIQRELKAPKGQFNSFGKYHYRSCEDILEAVKPLLGTATITITDEIVHFPVQGEVKVVELIDSKGNKYTEIINEDRFYVKATATIKDGTETESVSAFARESDTKKGMDVSQITGAASSYARKYALNGLLAIDDNKDADSHDNTNKTEKVAKTAKKGASLPKEEEPRVRTEEEMSAEEKLKKVDLQCSVCSLSINGAEKHYSIEKYGAKLCRDCQENASPLKKNKGQNE